MESFLWQVLFLFLGIHFAAKVVSSSVQQQCEAPKVDEGIEKGSFLLLQYLAEAYPSEAPVRNQQDPIIDGTNPDDSIHNHLASTSSQGNKPRSSIPAWELDERDSYFPPFVGESRIAEDVTVVIPKAGPPNDRQPPSESDRSHAPWTCPVPPSLEQAKNDVPTPGLVADRTQNTDDSDYDRALPKYGPPQLWKLLDHYREYLGLRYRLPFLIPEERPTKPMRIPIKRRPLAEICAIVETYPAEFFKFNFSALKRIAVLLAAVAEDPQALDFIYDYKKGLVVSHVPYWLFLLSPTEPKHYELARILTTIMVVFIRRDFIAEGRYEVFLPYSIVYGAWLACRDERIVRNIMALMIEIYRVPSRHAKILSPGRSHNQYIAILVNDIIPKHHDLVSQLLAHGLLKLIVNVNYDAHIQLVPSSLRSFIK